MNGMYCLYLIALIPVIIGFILYIKNSNISFVEWLIGTIVALLITGTMHLCSYVGMTKDVEIWSGKIMSVEQHPFWVEEYEVAIYDTESYYDFINEEWDTREVFSHYETRYRDHNEYFIKHAWFGTEYKEFRIGKSEYKDLGEDFGGKIKISTYEFDKLNAQLGPIKKVNLIIVGFFSADSKLGKLQEAKWVGGKKNDVVICYGYAPLEGGIPNVCWTYCFSWCKNDLMKRNIEKMFYKGPIDNTILPKLEKEIMDNFKKREWSEFDNLTVKPRALHYQILIGVMFLVQIGLYIVFSLNGYDKGD